jgi:RimJ/RimL family protein N-acetyltransferase
MSARGLMRYPRLAIGAAALMWRNLIRARRLRPIVPRSVGDYRLCGMDHSRLAGALSLYQSLHDGRSLDIPRRWLYRLVGSRLGIVALDAEGQVVGAAFYSFNPRDLREGRVHSSFSGVLPAHRGRGVATELRRTAILHFRDNGLAGYSARISSDNLPSLKASYRLGFRVVERYRDPASQEERCFLVCDFDSDYCDETDLDIDKDGRWNPAKDSA